MRIAAALAALLAAPSAWAQSNWPEQGDPTAAEQLVLEIINRARADPVAEGARLATASPNGLPGGDITEGLSAAEIARVGAKPPLAMNSRLLAAARAHSQDMWTRVFFAHTNPDGVTSSQRMTNQGYSWMAAGENIAASGSGSAAYLEDLLMVDFNYPGRGHRVNLLSLLDPGTYGTWREIGVGYYPGAAAQDFPPAGPSGNLKDFLTQDFGWRSGVGPFVLGVVYDDANTNSSYDLGEGLAGVTVSLSPAGTWQNVSSTSGGYSFPVSAGMGATVTVRATGGPFGANVVIKTFVYDGANKKIDFRLGEALASDTDADGLSDAWETAEFGNLAQNAAGDPDGDTYTNLQEMQAGTDPENAASNPGAGGGGGGGGSDSDGGCGSVGVDLLLPALLLVLARRRR
jgi:hypothetical protein